MDGAPAGETVDLVPPAPSPPPWPSPRPLRLGFSFAPAEAALIARVAGRARIWGSVCAGVGVVQVAASVFTVRHPAMISYLPAGVIAILIGGSSLAVARALRASIEPGVHGMHALLIALETLGQAFLVQIVTTLVGLLVVSATFLLGAAVAALSYR